MHGASGPGMHAAWTIALLAALAGASGVYVLGWMRARSRARRIASPWHPIAFTSGVATVWIVMGSPLAAMHERMLVFHMVQHLLLSLVAAPLVLLGAPSVPMLYGLPRSVAGLARTRVVRACCEVLAEPRICLAAGVAVFVAWHVPALFQLGFSSHGWHAIEQLTFFTSGLMFWWPIVQPWPSAPRWPRYAILLYLFFATLPCDTLSAFLAFSERTLYPAYLTAKRPGGWTALNDQECAGAVMWLAVTLAYGIPATVIAARLLSMPPRVERLRQNSRDHWYFSQ